MKELLDFMGVHPEFTIIFMLVVFWGLAAIASALRGK